MRDVGGFDAQGKCGKILIGAGECLESFHVRLVEPVNIYSQSDGAVKYGFLFIWLTFGVFFFFEVLAQLRIHPTQYTFAGAAVTIFFLLLLSLSEHFQFGIAYSLAAAACVLLLTYYLGHVLGSFRRGSIFGAMLAALYGVLYGLLLSEDNALLLGSLLIFALLSIAMIAARRVNWYGLGDGLAQLYRHDTAVPTKKAT